MDCVRETKLIECLYRSEKQQMRATITNTNTHLLLHPRRTILVHVITSNRQEIINTWSTAFRDASFATPMRFVM